MSISVTQIKYVLALSEKGSFSEAADHCFITQSTLSTMIKKLENEIGVQLFDRKSKPIRLTNEGLNLISQFKVINHEYINLLQSIDELKDEFKGTLKIGVIPTIAPFLLPLFLDKVVTKYPKINFIITESTTQNLISDIQDREIDIGILSLPIFEKNIIQKSLYSEDFLVYDTRQERVNKNKHYTIKDIDTSRLWLLEEGHCLTHQIKQICHLKKKRKLSGNLIYKSGSILSLLELVNLNHGITLLPRLATTKSRLFNQDYFYTLGDPTPVRDVGIISHPHFYKGSLLDLIESEIKMSVAPHLADIKSSRIIAPQ